MLVLLAVTCLLVAGMLCYLAWELLRPDAPRTSPLGAPTLEQHLDNVTAPLDVLGWDWLEDE